MVITMTLTATEYYVLDSQRVSITMEKQYCATRNEMCLRNNYLTLNDCYVTLKKMGMILVMGNDIERRTPRKGRHDG